MRHMPTEIANILSQRYASADIQDLWSETGRIKLEREFWIAVLKAQADLGLDIPAEAIEALSLIHISEPTRPY